MTADHSRAVHHSITVSTYLSYSTPLDWSIKSSRHASHQTFNTPSLSPLHTKSTHRSSAKYKNVQFNSVTKQNSRCLKSCLKKLSSVREVRKNKPEITWCSSGTQYHLMNILMFPRCLCFLGHTPVFDKIIWHATNNQTAHLETCNWKPVCEKVSKDTKEKEKTIHYQNTSTFAISIG